MNWKQLVSIRDDDKKNKRIISIAVPNNWPHFPAAFVRSFFYMRTPDGITTNHLFPSAAFVDLMRNMAVELAFQRGATHLFFVDADMVCPVDGFMQLWKHIEAGEKIVSGMAWRRGGDIHPCIYNWDANGRIFTPAVADEWWERIDPIRVDGVGAACLLVDMDVFEAIGFPWFEAGKDDLTGNTYGEDLEFCRRVKDAGFKILVDPSVTFGHLIRESYYGEDGIVYADKDRLMPTRWIDMAPEDVPPFLAKHMPRHPK